MKPQLQNSYNFSNVSFNFDNKIITKNFGIDIKNHDLNSLHDSNWINDNIIDFYLNLLCIDSNYYPFSFFLFDKYARDESCASLIDSLSSMEVTASFKKFVVPVILNKHWNIFEMSSTSEAGSAI